MRSICSAVLILCLIALPIPVAALEKKAGPLEASIAREAARLAATQQQDAAADTAWRRVTELASGTNIRLTLKGVGPLLRRFVTGDLGQIRVVPLDASADSAAAEIVPRSDVLEVSLPAKSGSIWAGVIAGGATFALVGVPAALGIATEVQCQPNCGAEKAGIALLMVGLPIGAGYAAYRLIGGRPEQVLYRARLSSIPIDSSAPLW